MQRSGVSVVNEIRNRLSIVQDCSHPGKGRLRGCLWAAGLVLGDEPSIGLRHTMPMITELVMEQEYIRTRLMVHLCRLLVESLMAARLCNTLFLFCLFIYTYTYIYTYIHLYIYLSTKVVSTNFGTRMRLCKMTEQALIQMQRKIGLVNNWRHDSSVAWRKQRNYQNVINISKGI